jgi:ABC-2 type transport system ATP-binding protein
VSLLVSNLFHRYADRDVLGGVSFEVRPNEVFALLGPNGSGKSTLFRILATLMTPTSGTATVFGDDVVTAPAKVRRSIGVVFQHPALDNVLTARENLLHHGHLFGLSGADLNSRIDAALASVELADRAKDRVGTFSGGMKRRLEIAKATLSRPRLLMLDEPDTGLDVAARASLRTMLRTLAQSGVTVLLTTHLMDLAEACDRVALLDGGKIVALDTPDALVHSVGGDVVTVGVNEADRDASLAQLRSALSAESDPRLIDGDIVVRADRPSELLPIIVQTLGPRVRTLAMHRPTLEDVFLQRTGRRLGQVGE